MWTSGSLIQSSNQNNLNKWKKFHLMFTIYLNKKYTTVRIEVEHSGKEDQMLSNKVKFGQSWYVKNKLDKK